MTITFNFTQIVFMEWKNGFLSRKIWGFASEVSGLSLGVVIVSTLSSDEKMVSLDNLSIWKLEYFQPN